MIDWLRVLGWSVVSLLIALGFLGVGWLAWSRENLRKYRLGESTKKSIQDSQRGRRPMWHANPESKERER